MTGQLAVVILQYGNWRQTVACLQSLVPAVRSGAIRVVLVDNASPDDSAAQVEAWISGAHAHIPRPVHDVVASHWWPLAGDAGAVWNLATPAQQLVDKSPWTLLRSPHNRGFACGMNLGVSHALSDATVNAVWLLNNDTVVDAHAVNAVVAAVAGAPASTGQFGTTVCYYDRPTILQSVGWCLWNPWLATPRRVHDGASVTQSVLREARQPGYVYGASWIIRAAALRDVGMLSEEGFLFGEELDWSCRAAARWQTGLISDAIVWHHEGATVGARASTPSARSELVDLCAISARLRLSRRFFPRQLPAVYSSVLGAALNRLRQGDAYRAAAVVRLVLAGGLPAPWPASHSSKSS